MNFPNLYDLSFEELVGFLAEMGERPFRAKQLYAWLYGKGENDFAAMTDIPAASRVRLAESARTDGLFLAESLSSADGSTTKYLFGTDDGHYIETVFMKYKDRNSICISAQVGCRMGCKFCASGKLGLKRNLTPAELALEVILTERAAGALAKNIVLMGIGEPLDNFDAVKKFIENFTDDHGRDLSRRAITLSTCGLVPGIRRLAAELPQVNLAVSLHAPNDKLREEIMPVTKRYGVAAVVAATQQHYETTHRRATFEYTLIEGFNDSPAQARELATLLRGMNCLVNLIPLNTAAPVAASDATPGVTKGAIPDMARVAKPGVSAGSKSSMTAGAKSSVPTDAKSGMTAGAKSGVPADAKSGMTTGAKSGVPADVKSGMTTGAKSDMATGAEPGVVTRRRDSGAETTQRFRDILGERGVPATIRRSLGSDIEAACGQLRLRYES